MEDIKVVFDTCVHHVYYIHYVHHIHVQNVHNHGPQCPPHPPCPNCPYPLGGKDGAEEEEGIFVTDGRMDSIKGTKRGHVGPKNC